MGGALIFPQRENLGAFRIPSGQKKGARYRFDLEKRNGGFPPEKGVGNAGSPRRKEGSGGVSRRYTQLGGNEYEKEQTSTGPTNERALKKEFVASSEENEKGKPHRLIIRRGRRSKRGVVKKLNHGWGEDSSQKKRGVLNETEVAMARAGEFWASRQAFLCVLSRQRIDVTDGGGLGGQLEKDGGGGGAHTKE